MVRRRAAVRGEISEGKGQFSATIRERDGIRSQQSLGNFSLPRGDRRSFVKVNVSIRKFATRLGRTPKAKSSGNCPPILVTMTESSPEKLLGFFDNKNISPDKQQFRKCHVQQESLGRQVPVIRLLRLARVKSCRFRYGNFLFVHALAKESFLRKNFFHIFAV